MTFFRTMLACCMLDAAGAQAQMLSIFPQDPRPIDTITLSYRPAEAPAGYCPEIAPRGLVLDTLEPGVVVVDVYDDEGRATWFVVTDARYAIDGQGRGAFEGTLYAAFGMPALVAPGPFAGVEPLGTAVLHEGGTDDAVLDLGFAGGSAPLTRTIARMRF